MFKNVLVGVDGRQGGRDAIALARRLARRDARMTFGHVYSPAYGRGASLALPLEREEAEALLAREREAAAMQAELVTCVDSPAGRGLHWIAERTSADLLVVGSSHRGLLGRVFLGDQASRALNGAPCATAVAPLGYASTTHTFSTIGVGYDGSPESERALALARQVATRDHAKIKARFVLSLQAIPAGSWAPPDWPEVVERLTEEKQAQVGALADVDGDVAYGGTGEELARLGRDVDLLVVGSRSYGPLGRMMHGSTSSYLARHSECPLLVLPRSATESSATDLAAHETKQPTAAPS